MMNLTALWLRQSHILRRIRALESAPSSFSVDRDDVHHFCNSMAMVTAALRESGLESSNLIVGIDFTRSNESTGKKSFNGKNLHAIGDIKNPYEQAIYIIGHTLLPFDEDNLIHCFGFGDESTQDYAVFKFFDGLPFCRGLDETLSRYRQIAPLLSLSGPTSFAPIIEVAMHIVENSGGQFHVLVIVTDGQVSKNYRDPGQLGPQEQKTIDAIVSASQYALSIVLVGVGDGPWEAMQQFDYKIPQRSFDNFQFVNFTKIMSSDLLQSQKEAEFALSALMETPFQYKATKELNILGRKVGKAPGIVARLPLSFVISHDASLSSSSQSAYKCPICWDNSQDTALSCGHLICEKCSKDLLNCPICRGKITRRLLVRYV